MAAKKRRADKQAALPQVIARDGAFTYVMVPDETAPTVFKILRGRIAPYTDSFIGNVYCGENGLFEGRLLLGWHDHFYTPVIQAWHRNAFHMCRFVAYADILRQRRLAEPRKDSQ